MIAVLALLLGGAVGAAFGHSFDATLGGAFVGLLAGLLVRAYYRDRFGGRNVMSPTAGARASLVEQRLAGLEQRVLHLEALLTQLHAGVPASPSTDLATPWQGARTPDQPPEQRADTSVPAPGASMTADLAPPAAATDGGAGSTAQPLQPEIASIPGAARGAVPPPAPRYGARASAGAEASRADVTAMSNSIGVQSAAIAPSSPANAPLAWLWRWFTSGNALTRVGVVILFFGVAFLLRYFAEHFALSIEAKLLGVALLGAALLGAGGWLRTRRPGYGLSLQGAGAGTLYLTTFAALHLYGVLTPGVALGWLVAIAVLTVALAWRADSQALAALAVAGAFLAPLLVAQQPGSPAMLFGYFAIVNGVIFVLAWGKSWRALNVLGFVFTFALGAMWGWRYYNPTYFATVEPFLILFFAFYVAIAILYARRHGWSARAPVDALLVFGVPLVGFALQAALVSDTRYGAAWSAFALALVYAVLFLWLRSDATPGRALLARAFLVLAIIFATVGIPFAAQSRWTSACWALEGAAVYWIGCRQRQPFARYFALVVQLAAAIAFLGFVAADVEGRLFLNANFSGAALVGIAGLACAWLGDRYDERLQPLERGLRVVMFIWGSAWWLGAGVSELLRDLPRSTQANAMLGWVTGSSIVALVLRRPLRWPRLAAFGAFIAPAMIVAGLHDLRISHTTLLAWGIVIWPLAWLTLGVALHDATPSEPPRAGDPRHLLALAHVAVPIGLVMQVAWEGSEWVSRVTPDGSVWIACAAALPAVIYLALVSRWRDSSRWPLGSYRESYTVHAGLAMAALLGVWFVAVNLMSPGDPAPLPYAPLLNPLDLTLLAAIVSVAWWLRRCSGASERSAYVTLGLGVFVALNGIVLRTGYHWLDLPWSIPALLHNKPVQAALTLTWTATALPLMVWATRRRIRPLWMVGAGLLAAVVAKLFLLDLANLSGLPRVSAFLGVGVLLLLIGYFAPLPPGDDPRAA